MAQVNISQPTANYTTSLDLSNQTTIRMPTNISCRLQRLSRRLAKRLDKKRREEKEAAFDRLYVAQIVFGSVLGAISVGIIVHAIVVLCKADKSTEQQQLDEIRKKETRLDKMTTQVVEESNTIE